MNDQNIDKENTSFLRKLRSLYSEKKWLLIWMIFGASFLLAIWGFYIYLRAKNPSLGDVFYKTLQLMALNDGTIEVSTANWQLEVSRIALPCTVAWAVIEGFVLALIRQFNLFRMTRLKGHYIICGLGNKGSVIANDLIEQNEGKEKNKIVVLDIDEKNENIGVLKEAGALVLSINALDAEWLKMLNPDKAKKIFVMTGNDEVNLAIARKLSLLIALSQKTKGNVQREPQVITHINSPFIWKLLSRNNAENSLPERVVLSNTYDSSARIALGEILSSDVLKKGAGIKLCIFGFGWLVQSLILNLSRQVYLDGLVINVIDGAAKNHEKEFFRQYPFLSSNPHQEFYLGRRIFPEINFHERHVEQLQRDEMKEHIEDDVIFFGLDDDLLEIELAMQIRQLQLTADNQHRRNIVFISKSSSLADNFINTCTELGITILYLQDGVRPLTRDHEERKQAAKNVHERYLEMTGSNIGFDDLKPLYLNDNYAQIDFWENYKKWSGLDKYGVENRIEELADLEHRRWLAYRIFSGEQFGCAEGCREKCAKGLVADNCRKDESKKLHPCLVSYEMLSDYWKEFDRKMVRGRFELGQ